jgi:hypothetical protein
MDQYSLSQRFQGALLGATIGQAATTIDFQPCLNWLCDQTPPPNLGPEPITNAIALLPLWLYTHESWRARQNRLEQILNSQCSVAEQSQSSILNSQFLWLYGEAIAQALRPQTTRADFLPNLQTRWQQHARHGAPALTPTWANCLSQIHQWQQQRTPLHQVQADLTNRPAIEQAIASSLFSYVSSGDDWTVANQRGWQLGGPAIGALLGALWGADYGWHRFPIAAIQPFTDRDHPTIPHTPATAQLIQAWSGNLQRHSTPIVLSPR